MVTATMSHAEKLEDTKPLHNHDDPTYYQSGISSSAQLQASMANGSILDRDTQTFYAKKYRQVCATAPSSALAVLIGAPLENVKTRMQSKYFSNAIDCIRYTFRTEGLRGFFAGMWGPLASITVVRTAGFSVYRWAKYELDNKMEKYAGYSPLQHVNKPGTFPNPWTITLFAGAGAISGGLLSFALTPVELLKNATQTSVLMAAKHDGPAMDGAPKQGGRLNSWTCAKQIIERKGFFGLYTGFRLHFVRDTLGSAVYFGVYETAKQSLNSWMGSEKANSFAAIAGAGALCGAVSWGVTYPFDTMKTRAQSRLVGNPAKETAESLAKMATRGSKWKGIEIIILRSMIQNIVQMTLFEQAKVMIDDLTFKDGSKTLPQIERELGRDRKRSE